MKQTITYLILVILYFLSLSNVNCQVLNKNSECILKLNDGLKVVCYQEISSTTNYYYLPVNLRLSTNKKGDKEFSFLTYKNAQGQPKGAIMHWLLTWGLTKHQLTEANKLLKHAEGNNLKLLGAVLPELDRSNREFKIKGNSIIAKKLQESLTSRGAIPVIANSKTAASFNFNASNAQYFKNCLQQRKELSDILISMSFQIDFKTTNSIKTEPYKISKNLQQLLKNIL